MRARHPLLRLIGPTAIPLLCLASVACGSREPQASVPQTAADSQAAHVAEVVAAGGVVDSILPIEEHLRRFRAGLVQTDTLRHASASMDALVERWVRAVRTRDSVELNRMVLDRAEFAWLYYPTAALSKPPYEAPPELLWGQILAASDEGARRLLARVEGGTFAVRDLRCGDSVDVEGANRIRQRCTVRATTGSAQWPASQLFGSIIERDGRFKFISFSNRL